MGWDRSVVPDPQDPETFTRSKLRWDERGEGVHARILALYRDLIALRRRIPDLTDPAFGAVRAEADESARAFRLRRGDTEILVNFATASVTIPVPPPLRRVLLATDERVRARRRERDARRALGAGDRPPSTRRSSQAESSSATLSR